jgi:hypothetical protein
MFMSDRLMELRTRYIREAHKAAKGRAYLAATVMQVAALEASLQAMCLIYWDQVKKTETYDKRKSRKRGFQTKNNRAVEFSQYELIKIADELGWFPPKRASWLGMRKTLAKFSQDIRDIRNRVHPGVWARRMSSNPTKFNKAVFTNVTEVCEVASSWLLHRIEKDLVKGMEREERKHRK